ncbi:MarR family winged helix-turn-helix transcriptional regulator [Streptococcus ictaluri]|uniref:Transcriptional regulator, MarR family n=1 Tax=Streptococcus ictaluri 707-05 TaxID=764299 RepID=G5JZJ8_9STRE|nr:MarR family transcriptional regulator [Streptococcus ictaluri]EHI70977.1 transcriptional regulator, MarR family [Streptococcus ictaluri 707-05]
MSQIIADLRELTHQVEQISDEIARKYHLEHLAGPQGHVLVFLEKHKGQEIFVKDIEKKLQISKSVASNLVKRMEKNGFIEVIPSTVDKRCKQVVLTEAGRGKLPVLQECRRDIENYFFKEITREELLTVKKVVQQLKHNMMTYKGDTDA